VYIKLVGYNLNISHGPHVLTSTNVSNYVLCKWIADDKVSHGRHVEYLRSEDYETEYA
jgi:hypothetical protein